MTLQASGAITLAQIAAEFGGAAPHSLSEYYRGGIYVPNGPSANVNISLSGAIRFNMFYGSMQWFVFNQTIAVDTLNYNLRTALIAAGWNQTNAVSAVIMISTGIYIGSSSISISAFDCTGSFPLGSNLTLTNNGVIIGCGGMGGYDNGASAVGSPGNILPQDGGPAIKTTNLMTINIINNGTIAGGGGGGSATLMYASPYYTSGGGGGAGYIGGAAGWCWMLQGYNGVYNYVATAGTRTAGGAAGGVGPVSYGVWPYLSGAGGGPGLAGEVAIPATTAPGSAGAYVIGNTSVTWTTIGTRLGAVVA